MDPDNSQELIDRSVELAKAVEGFQQDLGVSSDVSGLKTRADATDILISRGRLMRRIVTAVVVFSLVLVGLVGYSTVQLHSQTVKLRTLIHTECVRSEKGAELRTKLIDDLTKHVAKPQPGSPAGLIKTVKERNLQLDAERRDLLHTGSKIPNVKC